MGRMVRVVPVEVRMANGGGRPHLISSPAFRLIKLRRASSLPGDGKAR